MQQEVKTATYEQLGDEVERLRIQNAALESRLLNLSWPDLKLLQYIVAHHDGHELVDLKKWSRKWDSTLTQCPL